MIYALKETKLTAYRYTGCRLSVCRLLAGCCKLQTVSCKLTAVGRRLQAGWTADCKLQVCYWIAKAWLFEDRSTLTRRAPEGSADLIKVSGLQSINLT